MNAQVPSETSDTPKTDTVEVYGHDVYGNRYYVSAEFAREIERELTEANRSLRREENARKVLADENDRLRKDARRYQWLRSRPHMDIAACWLLPNAQPHIDESDEGAFDAAIDAAMEKKS